jgi:pSer/pThr/pTyr-binding forkhead associated (FHA) protein
MDAAMTATRHLLRKVSDGKVLPLAGEVLVGRKPPATILLTEGQPSRRHALLVVGGEGVTVEDLESTNGTFVNGLRIAGKVLLADGDRIAFDKEEYQFVVQGAPDVDATMMRAPAAPEAAPPRPPPPPPKPPSPPQADQRPGGWVDPGQNKTQYFDPRDLKNAPQAAIPAPRIEDPDAPYLIVCSGKSSGTQFRLSRGSEGQQSWTVGSDAGRDVRLGDSGVSGLHARIIHENARWKVVDEMSANGIYVNGKRSPVAYLATNDQIRFGPVECLLQLPRSRPAAPAARPAAQGAPAWRRTAVVVVVSFLLTAIALYVAYGLLQ